MYNMRTIVKMYVWSILICSGKNKNFHYIRFLLQTNNKVTNLMRLFLNDALTSNYYHIFRKILLKLQKTFDNKVN